jgi:[ribosomal protein S5]-alanine N-acetyltransferase
MIQPIFTPFPVLETSRLLLREIDFNDTVSLFKYRGDPEVMKYIGRPLAKELADVTKLIDVLRTNAAENNGITWAITLKGENILRGTIGFWRIVKEHHRAEIGYLLDPALQGKGIMQEAVEEVLRYGFEEMGLHSVEAVINPDNLASIRLLERNAFVKEAYFREDFCFDGKFQDTCVYSLLEQHRIIKL